VNTAAGQPGPATAYPYGYQQVGGQNGGYNGMDDDEDVQQKCMLICCGVCCPCCIGDPFTEEWRSKVYNTWFRTFVGGTGFIIVVTFLVEVGLSPHEKNLNGYISLDPTTMKNMGAKDTYEIVVNFQIWRLITCMFLHAGWMHMWMNLFVQMSVGWLMETGIEIAETIEIQAREPWGVVKTGIIYMSAGLTGSLLGCVASPNTMCVGASGAIMGLIGAKLMHLYLFWDRMGAGDNHMAFKRKMDACQTVFWVLLIFSLGLGNPLIDNWAHLGGLAAGALAACAIFSDEANQPRENSPDPPSQMEKHRGKLCGGVLAAANVIMFAVLFTAIRSQYVGDDTSTVDASPFDPSEANTVSTPMHHGHSSSLY